MPTPARHSIQRQTVLLDTPSQQLSFSLQDRMLAYCRNQLPAVLERLFDRFADSDTTIRLDLLTIDAGNLSVAKLEDELTQQISQQLEQVFGQLSGQAGPITTNGYGNGTAAGSITGRIERISREDRLAQQFRHFLLTGRLPTWADARDFAQIDQWLTTPAAHRFRAELAGLLRVNPALASRLIHHSSDLVLVAMCFGSAEETTVMLVRLLVAAIQQLTDQFLPTVRERYWQSVLAKAATEQISLPDSLDALHKAFAPAESPTLFFGQLRSFLEQQTTGFFSADVSQLLQTLTRLIEINATTKRSPAGTRMKGQKNQENEPNTPDSATHPRNRASPQPDEFNPVEIGSPVARSANVENPPGNKNDPALPQKMHGHTNDAASEDELFVSLAGIVLLHPFLVPLFLEMGLLTTNRQWIDEAAAAKGVQTLAYLATGDDYCPEYDMTLLKLVCGLPFDSIVSPNLVLTDTDRQHATELLDAVIGHWDALGNVSPDGLREAFLQRTAKLTPAGPGWRLTVEGKTLDILMNRLPWGYSTIKLPFMANLLFIDWT